MNNSSQNRPTGVMNLNAIIAGVAIGLIITICCLMSDVRPPLAWAIGLLVGLCAGYGYLHYLYNNASDTFLAKVVHFTNDPLELLIKGGRDGIEYDPASWENPDRAIQTNTAITHDEGNGWQSTIMPSSDGISTPVLKREYIDPITKMEQDTAKFWANVPSLQSLLSQLLEAKEIFVFAVKKEVFGDAFATQLKAFTTKEMSWIMERLQNVYENYPGMDTQRMFVWNFVNPVVELSKKLLLIQREAGLASTILSVNDAQTVLQTVQKNMAAVKDEFNFDKVEQLNQGTTTRTNFEHLAEAVVAKQFLLSEDEAKFMQRWYWFDKEMQMETLSPYTLTSVDKKAIWHPLIGAQLLERMEWWNFTTLPKYTPEELSWKWLHMTDATNGSPSFAEVFKETVRFYKPIAFDAIQGRDGKGILQSSLLNMRHEESIDMPGQLHAIGFNSNAYTYDSRHLVFQMRGSYTGEKAGELLYIQFKNPNLQNNRYLLMIIDRSVSEVRCYVGDKVEQGSTKVQLIS